MKKCLPALLAFIAALSQPAMAQNRRQVVHESWSVRDGLPTNLLTDILQSRSGYLWISSFDGLIRFDGVRFKVFNVGNSDGLPSNRIIGLYENNDTTLWLVTEDLALVSFRAGRFRVTGQRATPRPRNSPEFLEYGEVARSIVDREGSTWVATRANGLHRFKPAVFEVFGKAEGTYADIFYVVAKDHNETMWAPQYKGIVRIANDRVTRTPVPWADGTNAVMEDSRGRLWFGDVMCEQPITQCAPRILPPGTGYVLALHEDDNNDIWFGTTNGLFILADGKLRRVSEAEGAPRSRVRAFARSPDQTLWLATAGDGLVRYRDGRFRHITTADGLPSNFVRALYTDADSRVWVGTEGRGIARVGAHAEKPVIVSIRQEHGLYDDFVHQILEDDFGRLWMSTNRGIFSVDRAQLNDFADGRITRVRSTSYTERHGMRNREANGGSQPAGVKTKDGRLWFPTQGGIVRVDPRNIATNHIPPNVVIEQVMRTGERERDITVEFTALSFLAPENVRFRYKLDGYDGNWIDADTRRTAFYTKVPPGHYTFRVMAANDAGVWNAKGAAAAIVIAPLFFETWWFKLLVFGAGVVLVGAAVRYRIKQVRIAAEAAQLRELDRAKSRFFANVSHEFRTPLTLTIGPLEDARAELAGTGQDRTVARIDMALRSARRLFTLVTQVLDVAKLEAGSMQLHLQPGDLVTFTRGVMAGFETLAERKQIEFTLHAPSEPVVISYDADALEKVVTNLLSNAFKFTPDGGEVSIVIALDDVARMSVSDSGPGIPAKDLPHVFERFYQVDESNVRTPTGTGIGLALTQELVELHGGKIAVASGEAGGAVFTVTFPLLSRTVATSTKWDDADDVTTLLIVDDSDDMRAFVRGYFEDRYRVIEAADGDAGIAAARSALPDLVISDVMMPGRTGHELVEALRAHPETDFLPIILLTAAGDSDLRIGGFERGADDYITKPFNMRELAARVDNLIASRRHLRERFAVSAPVTHTRMVTSETSHSRSDQALIERLTAALEANLSNPDFGVAELADAVFQDRSHLFRKTKELLGETPSDLLRRVRLERAAQLLTDGDDGIADIAYAVGFNSVSAFCRAFRERYERTPSGYREGVSVP